MAYTKSKPIMRGPDLTDITFTLLINRHYTFEEIAAGTGISYHTVVAYARGAHNPSARIVQAIYEFLTGKTLL